jgi:hypothetical protein
MPNGGKRPGAGRKKGSKNKATLEKQAVLAEFNQRVLAKADDLFNAQFKLATGSQRVFRIDETRDGKGKVLKREHVWVTDPAEIKRLLDDHDGESGDVDGTFYYFQAVVPDNKAIDSLMNRTFGRAKESMELSGPEGAPIETRTILPTK